MATKNITSWDEFVDAWTESISEDTTYIIQEDIDVSGSIIDTGTTYYCPAIGTYKKTFTTPTPDDKTKIKNINGITSYTSGVVLSLIQNGTGRILFNCIGFTNFNIYSGGLFQFPVQNSHGAIFQNCVFTGIGSIVYAQLSSSTTINSGTSVFYQCLINLKANYLAMSASNQIITLSCCWIHYDKLGDNQAELIGSHMYLTNVYIEGTVSYKTTSTNVCSLLGTYSNAHTVVFNLDLTISGSSVPQYFYGFYGTSANKINGTLLTSFGLSQNGVYNDAGFYNLYNIDNWTTNKQLSSTTTSGTGYYQITSNQLKSETDINAVCPNFPIST